MDEERTVEDESIVSVAGIIQKVRLKTTRNNSMMAYVTLEDDTGSMELLTFSNVLTQFGSLVQEGAAVVVIGRLSIRDEKDPQVVVNRVRSIFGLCRRQPPGGRGPSLPGAASCISALPLRQYRVPEDPGDFEHVPRHQLRAFVLCRHPGSPWHHVRLSGGHAPGTHRPSGEGERSPEMTQGEKGYITVTDTPGGASFCVTLPYG